MDTEKGDLCPYRQVLQQDCFGTLWVHLDETRQTSSLLGGCIAAADNPFVCKYMLGFRLVRT